MAWTDTMDISLSKLLEVVKDSEAWRADEVTRLRHLLVTESCVPMDCRMPGFPVLHYLPELA